MKKSSNLEDPTLAAVDAALEARAKQDRLRPYLGMSSIGHPCARHLFYSFRWCGRKNFSAATLKRFTDGHRGEAVMAERLRLVDEIELHTVDPNTGEQFAYTAVSGHVSGHMDGAITGLLQNPGEWFVWEHKQVDPTEQSALRKCVEQHGEKKALEEWSSMYYAQAVLYMHHAGISQHYLTCSTPGGRETISVMTDANPDFAEQLLLRARDVVEASETPERISSNPAWYQCKMCSYIPVCHYGTVPEVNCRTCISSTAMTDREGGVWWCEKWDSEISLEDQRQGCNQHVFIPTLLPYQQVDASDEQRYVEYEHQGKRFRNGPGFFSSKEIQSTPPAMLADGNVQEIKAAFNATVSSIPGCTKDCER